MVARPLVAWLVQELMFIIKYLLDLFRFCSISARQRTPISRIVYDSPFCAFRAFLRPVGSKRPSAERCASAHSKFSNLHALLRLPYKSYPSFLNYPFIAPLHLIIQKPGASVDGHTSIAFIL